MEGTILIARDEGMRGFRAQNIHREVGDAFFRQRNGLNDFGKLRGGNVFGQGIMSEKRKHFDIAKSIGGGGGEWKGGNKLELEAKLTGSESGNRNATFFRKTIGGNQCGKLDSKRYRSQNFFSGQTKKN